MINSVIIITLIDEKWLDVMASNTATAHARNDALTKTGLLSRGWTESAIIRFLGEPDWVHTSAQAGCVNQKHAYRLDRVERIEASPSFRAWLGRVEAKRGAKRATKRQREDILFSREMRQIHAMDDLAFY